DAACGEPAEFILPDGGLFRGFLLGRALGKKTKKSHGSFPYYRESRACLLARRAVLENISMRTPVSIRRPTARRPAVSSRRPPVKGLVAPGTHPHTRGHQ